MRHLRRLASAALALLALQACAGDGGTTGPGFDSPANETGTIALTTRAGGTALDPDGYTVRVDGIERGVIAVKGTTWFREVPVGAAEVRLGDIEPECSVVGANPRTVAVSSGEAVRISVDVVCGEPTGPTAP